MAWRALESARSASMVVSATDVTRGYREREADLRLAVPIGTLALGRSAVAGVIAAVLPARRAARIDVLTALAHE